MVEQLQAFALGWTFGAALMWYYFVKVRLIRTRREWYEDRERRGLRVPPDWRETEGE